MPSVQELLRSGDDLPTDSARRDTEILLCHCLGKSRAWLYTWPEKTVPEDCAGRFAQLLDQRRSGQPIAYLVGEREFWSLSLAVNNSTLIPRPETETLVAWALELALPEGAKVLDLGTGSGAIALAVAVERPLWRVTAVDSSADALQVARANVASSGVHNVSLLQSDWYQAVAGERFDALLANPPYIDSEDPHLTRDDVRFEPRAALVAASGGLADLQCLVSGAPAHLREGGWLLLEHGFAQAPAVRAMLSAAGFDAVETRCDIAGLERITGGRWHAD
ncbi:MAG: peptide chain release factor N(5)-glutamine methyltransferase [Halioglobus sp.]|nr:peptide chain release factor N(5)-glutamine methyltransferase [Halioglobus sp.]